jgi:hypothetical protein
LSCLGHCYSRQLYLPGNNNGCNLPFPRPQAQPPPTRMSVCCGSNQKAVSHHSSNVPRCDIEIINCHSWRRHIFGTYGVERPLALGGLCLVFTGLFIVTRSIFVFIVPLTCEELGLNEEMNVPTRTARGRRVKNSPRSIERT